MQRLFLRLAMIASIGLLLSASTVMFAQIAPTSAPQGEVASAIRESSDVISQVGVINFISITLAVGAVAVTGMFLWFFVRPLVVSNTAANQQIATMSAQAAATGLLTAQSLERLGGIVGNMETRPQAEGARTDAVENINTHTDETIRPVSLNVSSALEQLTTIRREIEQLVTQEIFDGAMERIQAQLENVIAELNKGMTKAPPTDPADPAPDSRVIVDAASLVPPDEPKE